jgi:uncharacterized SAM-binding protein YcdF (DUF218 family)
MLFVQLLISLFFVSCAMGVYGLREFRHTKSWKIMVVGLIGLGILSWPPIAKLSALPFVAPYIKQVYPARNPGAIVVLAGAVNEPTKFRPYVLLGQDTYKRLMHAVWYFHSRRALPILAAGGPEYGLSEPASASMRVLLEHEGVPPSMIWTEDRSRSTYENALFSAELLRQHGIREIVLVVDADSMLRAEKCFQKQGFAVTPMPSWVQGGRLSLSDLLPSWQAIYRHEILAHEGVGLLWYWLRGWI